MSDFTSIIGILASVFTAISLLPQLVKLVKEKKAGGISPLMLASLFIGLSCWTWYGILKNDWIIAVSNGFSLTINTIISILSIKYTRAAKTTAKEMLIGKL
jgi:MtN3 and saliva related transmembrane protein